MNLYKSLTFIVLCLCSQLVGAQPQRRAEVASTLFGGATGQPAMRATVLNEGSDDEWTSLGTGRMRDDFFTTLYIVDCVEFDVEVEENTNKPGLYRLVTPYRNYPYAPVNEIEEDNYMIVDATDPDHVFLGRCKTGFDFGDGPIEVYSVAGYKYDQEGNLDGAIDDGACGVLRNGHITFPTASLLVKYETAPEDQWRFANYNGQFRIKLPGAPNLDVNITLAGFVEGETDKVSFDIAMGDGCEKVRVALFQGEASNDSLRAMYDGSCNYQDITASGEVLFDYRGDGIYTIIAVPYYQGEPAKATHKTQELNYYNVGWKHIGQATYSEGFIADSEVPISGISTCTYQVDIEESTDRPGYFRLVDPYGDNYIYSNSLSYDYTRHYYMEIDATDPQCVSLKLMEDGCGYDMGYGRMQLWSRADRALGEGKTKDEVKELGYFGKVENEVITFPTNMLLIRYIDIPNTGWYWANLSSTFKLVLPEGSYTGIQGVEADMPQGEPLYYNLQGCRVNAATLTPGVYVKQQGSRVSKVLVK